MSTNTNRPIAPLLMIAAGVVLILGSLVGFASSTRLFATQSPTATPTPRPTVVITSVPQRIPYSDVSRVSLVDAKAAFDQGKAIFVDVRGDPYYSAGHIPGALSITYGELTSRMAELDKAAWIITYCT